MTTLNNNFNSEYCNVIYNEKENEVVLEWKKFASFDNYRKPTTFALELLRAKKAVILLSMPKTVLRMKRLMLNGDFHSFSRKWQRQAAK